MKRIYIIMLSGLVLIQACKMISTEDVTTRIVTPSFPGLTLKGDSVTSRGIGTGTFTDPGATGYDDIAKVTTELVPLVNKVDLTKAGFYSVQYETKNTYGYRTNKNRLVLVTSVDESDDISGEYRRTNGQLVTLTKKGRGLYLIDNVGGVPGNPDYLFPVYLGVTDLTTIQGPAQENPFGGNISVTDGEITRSGNAITIVYKVKGSGFSETPRTFTKVD